MRQIFEVPGKLPGANEYQAACRKHAKEGARMKREATEAVAWAAKAAKLKPMEAPVSVRITWVEPNMRRDKDNIRFGAKFVLDGLQEAGVIGNDNWEWIAGIADGYRVNSVDPRVIVELEEVEIDEP